MAKQPTIPVNVVDKSIPEYDDSLIAIINEPNPVTGYEINEQQLRQLIQMPQYWITDENGRTINGVNFYEYFPRGGGGSGRLPIVVEKTITENGVYMAVDDHADGYNKVIVNTPVPPPAPVLIEKTVTKNGTYLPVDDDADGYSKVNVEIPDTTHPIKFIDYDGTVIASYTKDEFANLSALPTNPSHEGLTSQGWNWSLSDAKEYVTKNGSLNIGQMYVTDDGKTRIYITLTEGRISPILQLYLMSNSELDIDWGDGSAHSTFTSTSADYVSERHNYSAPGDYIIAITVTTGSFALQSSSTSVSTILWNGNNSGSSPDKAYNNSIKKVEIGTDVSISNNTFYQCYSLSSITIPDSVTSIGNSAFQECRSLISITIPSGVTTISDKAFNGCTSLTSINIPDSVVSIGLHSVSSCYSLTSINIPDSVTSIGQYAISGNMSLTTITIGSGVTSIGENTFQSCYALQSITIPDTVTSINRDMFNSSIALSSFTIADTVTGIGQSAFYQCYSLQTITIGSSVTSIGQYAFYGCTYLESIKFKSTIPPLVTNGNTWKNVPTSCIIYVPTGSIEMYKAATNYPNPSTYTYIEY